MKYLLFVFMFCTFLFSKEITAHYSISFGIFGEIAKAEAKIIYDSNNTYEIFMDAYTTRSAKTLSRNRKEKFFSSGLVLQDGTLLPNIYRHEVERGSKQNFKKDEKIFKFDHENKKVFFKKIRSRKGNISVDEFSGLEYYAPNDLLSLFFNFKALSGNFTIQGNNKFYAVGANKTDGAIDLVVPKGKELKKIQKALKEDEGHFYIAFINQKIFSSEKGELLLQIGKNGISNKAILKDVLFFGDIKGKLVKTSTKEY